MEIVGLIPARGGSRSIESKNLAPLAGKPLLAWTLGEALASRTLTRTVVSTDSEEIAQVARAAGADVLERPEALARDDTPMLPVVRHAVEALHRPPVLVLLQPTSPLRRARHIDEAVELLKSSGAETVVSVVEVPHHFTPASLLELRDGRLLALDPAGPTQRQDKPRLYARNGPAVVVLRTAALGGRDDLYGPNPVAYEMDARDSIDVDDPFDLELAELLLSAPRR
jgi:CMP-N-acetylneuraminic acid synthetase